MSILVPREVFFSVSFSFGYDDVNQLRHSVVLIRLKIAYFQKYLRTCKSKKLPSSFIFIFRGKCEFIKHVLFPFKIVNPALSHKKNLKSF